MAHMCVFLHALSEWTSMTAVLGLLWVLYVAHLFLTVICFEHVKSITFKVGLSITTVSSTASTNVTKVSHLHADDGGQPFGMAWELFSVEK